MTVEKALALLDHPDPAEVAGFLASEGCYGPGRSSTDCPLCKWLRRKTGLTCYVLRDRVWYVVPVTGGEVWRECPLPVNLVSLVKGLDARRYAVSRS